MYLSEYSCSCLVENEEKKLVSNCAFQEKMKLESYVKNELLMKIF